MRTVWQLSAYRAYTGWDLNIRAYNVRPSDAPIFGFVQRGDLVHTRKLLERKMASPFDIDDLSINLLQVSTRGFVTKLLAAAVDGIRSTQVIQTI